MAIKTTFLSGYLNENIYVNQLQVFENFRHPDWVYKLDKTLYRLKYFQEHGKRLPIYLIEKCYHGGISDKTLLCQV